MTRGVIRKGLQLFAIAVVSALLLPKHSHADTALVIEDHYSRWNRTRPKRPHTHYIVLHTTESSGRSALEKLRRNGEAHYFVDSDGRVYRIIDKERIAKHAGLSLWEGRRALDNFSLGIEIAGFHDGEFNARQVAALRELIRQLRNRYGVPARNVVPHSMVAYGRPNRFHVANHRGRKRCAMVFASADLRERLGLNGRPLRDREVEKGMLKVGDRELHETLFPPLLSSKD